MIENLINYANRILQKAWYGNAFFHMISDFLYNLACLGYKLICIPTKEHRKEVIIESGMAQEEKDINMISRRMLRAWFVYGILPQEYVGFHFETDSRSQKRAYLCNVDGAKYCTISNDLVSYHIFRNKYEAYEAYKPYYKREIIRAVDINEDFIQRHPTFMFKPESSHKGIYCRIIHADDYPDLAHMKASVPNWDQGICEELIVQGEWAAAFHPESVNTCRIQTMITRDGGIKILGGFFRMGRGSAFVDNAFSGGILADIDVKTGIIDTDGADERGYLYDIHPDSGLLIKGSKIPDWENLRKMVLQLVKVTPELRMMGWDLAWTEDGWVMIEGNPFGAFAQQYATGKGLKKEILAWTKK